MTRGERTPLTPFVYPDFTQELHRDAEGPSSRLTPPRASANLPPITTWFVPVVARDELLRTELGNRQDDWDRRTCGCSALGQSIVRRPLVATHPSDRR